MRAAVLHLCAAFVLLAAGCAAAPSNPAAALQGRWIVKSGEHEGKPMDVANGGVLTVSEESFVIRTASGRDLKGTLRLDAKAKPAHIDFLHADGTFWQGIYAVTGTQLRVNYVAAGDPKDPRPTAFATSDKTEASLLVLQRVE